MKSKVHTSRSPEIERKILGGQILQYDTKQGERNGEPVGLIEGHIATFDLDEGGDIFLPGAFLDSLAEHRARDMRQIRMLSQHYELVGGWPIETAREDDTGLFGKGEINLVSAEGQKVHSLAKQKVLVDLSIGYSPREWTYEENDAGQLTRRIAKSVIWEGSPVDEPMNRRAQITTVKAFGDLACMDADASWDMNPKDTWILPDEAFLFANRSMPIARMDDGTLSICPKRLLDVAQELEAQDRPDSKAVRTVERYLAKSGLESPFSPEHRAFFTPKDVEGWDARELEEKLREDGRFSKAAARALVERLREPELQTDAESAKLWASMKTQLDEARASIG